MSDAPRIVYTPCPGATQETELRALAAVYRFLILEKGDRNDLTGTSTKECTTSQDKKGKRMPTYTATDYEPVPPGLYTARLENIEEATSLHGTYYRWCFLIEDAGEHKERKVYSNVSEKFGPQSKAMRWCEQMVGRAIRKGEQFDTDALLGCSYHIMVTNTPEDERGRVYDNVENVHRVRPDGKPKREEAKEPDDPEAEFNDLPW